MNLKVPTLWRLLIPIDVDAIDTGHGRPLATGFDQTVEVRVRPFCNQLYRPVGEITHPSCQTEPSCCRQNKVSKRDPLHPPTDLNM